MRTGDANENGIPDYVDNTRGSGARGDLNSDGRSNAVDIQIVVNAVLGIPVSPP